MPCKLARSSVEQAKEASSSHFLHLFQPSLASVLPLVQRFPTSVVNSEFSTSSIVPDLILPSLLLLLLLYIRLTPQPKPILSPSPHPGIRSRPYSLSNMYHYGGQHQSYYAARGAADDDAAPGPCCYFHPSEVVVGVCAVCLRERLLVLAAKQSGSSGRSGRGSIGGGVSGSCHLRPFSRVRRGGSTGSGSSRGKVISMISIPKVFALGSFLGGGGSGSRTEARRGRKKAAAAAAVDDPDEESISSLEDSFISIKFGTDGRASWDSKKTAAAAANPALKAKYIPSTLLPPTSGGFQSQYYPTTTCAVDDDQSSQRLSVVEHHKSRSSPLRWRKRIAHLLHLIRWRRSSSGNTSRPAAGGAAAQGCKADAAVAVVGKVPRRSGWMRSLTRRRSADRLA